MRQALFGHGPRGQPVFLLGLLLVGWAVLRIVVWQPPFAPQSLRAVVERAVPSAIAVTPDLWPRRADEEPGPAVLPTTQAGPALARWMPSPRETLSVGHGLSEQALGGESGRAAIPLLLPDHKMTPTAESSQMEVTRRRAGRSPEMTSLPTAPAAVPQFALASPTPAQDGARWSADAWLLWREDTTTPVLSGRPAYGRSQAGAVVRYDLAPGLRRRPQAHLRGSAALQGRREAEAAAGLSARLLPRIPLRVAGEIRVAETASGTDIRPAAYAVTELPPVELPGGLRGEAYAQGGYVGGDFATPFADGQARIDMALAGNQRMDLRAGAGAWGGAQEGVARVDIGPSASVSFELGDVRARLTADYRFRVAGDAQPSSGPALTLSAGF